MYHTTKIRIFIVFVITLLIGCKNTQNKTVEKVFTLHSASQFEFDGDVNTTLNDIATVLVLDPDNFEPVPDITVNFEVLDGAFELGLEKSKNLEVMTDENGLASINGKFTQKSATILAAEIPNHKGEVVFFRGHSNGMSHQISLYAEPIQKASTGIIVAKILVVDRNGQFVTNAQLHCEGEAGNMHLVQGMVTEIGGGEYEALIQSNVAGVWTISVIDLVDHVENFIDITVLAGAPKNIRVIGDTDPRAEPPYQNVDIGVRLEDSYGNAITSQNIEAKIDGKPISIVPTAMETQIPVNFNGYGSVNVEIIDYESGIKTKIPIDFASAWLEDPGFIWTGSIFTTKLYWVPEHNRPVTEAVINVRYDNELVSYVGFEPYQSDKPVSKVGIAVNDDEINISVTAKSQINAEKYPEGIYIGEFTWTCLRDGGTCFTLTSTMSPPTKPWEKCPIQKAEAENKKCVCVNIITIPGKNNNDHHAQGLKAAKQIESIISSEDNVKVCCPVIEVKIKSHKMTNIEWKNLNKKIGGDGVVNGIPDAASLSQTGIGVKNNCIDLYMIPANVKGSKGITLIGGPTSILSPDAMTASLKKGGDPRAGGHELGHALGLSDKHVKDRQNLNSDGRPLGAMLTKDQCIVIFQNIDKYACQ